MAKRTTKKTAAKKAEVEVDTPETVEAPKTDPAPEAKTRPATQVEQLAFQKQIQRNIRGG